MLSNNEPVVYRLWVYSVRRHDWQDTGNNYGCLGLLEAMKEADRFIAKGNDAEVRDIDDWKVYPLSVDEAETLIQSRQQCLSEDLLEY